MNLLGQISTRVYTADDVVSPYIYVFYIAFLVSFFFTPIMRMIATYYGIIDQPDSIRKMHSAPVAYLGGIAVFLGWMAGLALSQFLQLHRAEPGLLPHVYVKFSIVIGASVIVLLGLWDDIKRINPRTKIAGQVFAAICLLLEGIGSHSTESLLHPIGVRLQTIFHMTGYGESFFPEWFIVGSSGVLVIFAVVGCCNASNLMDGLDGLCGGVTAVIAAGFLFLAVHLAMVGGGLNSNLDALRVVLALALLGAVLGFVPFNFNPASIFMGDSGSMFLGFSCAVMIILMAQDKSKWLLAAMVMFALPVLDTLLAFARRYVNRRPIFSADKYHFHHQLVARGLTVRKTVIVSYALAFGFAILGSSIVFVRTRYAVAVYLVVFGSILVTAYKMGMVHEKPRVISRPSPLDSDDRVTPAAAIDSSNVLEIRDPQKRSGEAERPSGFAGV